MIRFDNTNDMFRKLINSLEAPSYAIHLSLNNKIISIDHDLVTDFHFRLSKYDDYTGLNILDLIKKEKTFENNFAPILADIIANCGTGLCAINTSFKHNTILIPAIHVLYIAVDEGLLSHNKIKELKIYNYIEISNFLSQSLQNKMFKPYMDLTKKFQSSIRRKSLYFAVESLRSLATFVSTEAAAKTNQQQLADLVFPFHRTRKKEVTQRFINEFLRDGGYTEYDKNRQISELGLDIAEYAINKSIIPFNRINKNFIIRLS